MAAIGLDALSGGRFILGLGSSGPQVAEGWHGVTFSRKASHYVDRYSALSTPPQVRLHKADGSVVRDLDANVVELRTYPA